ncbi:MAG: hypothetical protein H6Q10_3672 [Acidobacteria bacterium]|nr:hypothetical protein [Acidobacteriota bacterium]
MRARSASRSVVGPGIASAWSSRPPGAPAWLTASPSSTTSGVRSAATLPAKAATCATDSAPVFASRGRNHTAATRAVRGAGGGAAVRLTWRHVTLPRADHWRISSTSTALAFEGACTRRSKRSAPFAASAGRKSHT